MTRNMVWIVALISGACGDPGAGPHVPPGSLDDSLAARPVVSDAIDIGNTGTGTDLEVTLHLSADHDVVDEYRLVAYVDTMPPPTRDQVLALPTERHLAVYPDQNPARVRFDETSVDVEGTPLGEGVAYRVIAVAVPAEPELASPVSASTPTITLAQASYIETIAEIEAGSGGLALDDEGNLYMADFGETLDGPPGQVVFRITPGGDVSVYAQGFQGASGNAFDEEGNLFQSNIVGGFVSRIAPGGDTELRHVDGLNGPVGVVVTPDGELYVADCLENVIVHVAADGEVSTYVDSFLLRCPNGLARGPDGTLYVANFGNGQVVKIPVQGSPSVLAELPGGNLGHLSLAGDRLYVAARGANQMYEVDLGGNVTLIAGTGTRGLRNGSALEAQLSLTNDVVVSADGRILYFNDVTGTGNRVISPVAVRALHLLPEG